MDYGPRAGYWRVVKLLEKHSATCTANICAEAVQLYPALGKDLAARGFEISCHGRRWETPLGAEPLRRLPIIFAAILPYSHAFWGLFWQA